MVGCSGNVGVDLPVTWGSVPLCVGELGAPSSPCGLSFIPMQPD